MIVKKNNNYKLLQKKLLRLRKNPLNNNKFLKPVYIETRLVTVIIDTPWGPKWKKVLRNIFRDLPKKRKKKWELFARNLSKANNFFQKYKPYSFNHYSVAKFASLGTSYKKMFRTDLFTKKIFNHYYGGFRSRFLKKQMTAVYRTKQVKTSRILCVELFERRLDSVIRKAKFTLSIKDSRQLISHKHVHVNQRQESNYSYLLSTGDLIQIPKLKSKKIVRLKLISQLKERIDKVIWPFLPGYLAINYKTLEILFGKTTKQNHSSLFYFKNDYCRVVESHYRH